MGEEKRRGEGERDLLGCACALPPSQHTHTHVLQAPTHTPTPTSTHKHTLMHTQALISPFLPPSSPFLSPLAGLACCHPPPPLFLFLSSLPQQAQTHTQMHGLGCTLLPPQHPTHPQGRREGGKEYSTQPNSHATQAHHTPLHTINNENKAGKRKKKKEQVLEMKKCLRLFICFSCSSFVHF